MFGINPDIPRPPAMIVPAVTATIVFIRVEDESDIIVVEEGHRTGWKAG